jgi:hypothetical protein
MSPTPEQDQRDTNLDNRYKFAELSKDLADFKRTHAIEIKALADALAMQKAERDKFMIAGILALGGALVTVLIWVFNNAGKLLK